MAASPSPARPPAPSPPRCPSSPSRAISRSGPPRPPTRNFTTSVTEFLDTFSMVRGRHTIKFGTDLRREALDIVNPANPTGSYAFTTTGTDSSTGAGGNALASLLLGQVNAFSIDIQNQALQERAHIAEFFASDDWKVSDRLTLNLGTRYTLNFPSTEANQSRRRFQLEHPGARFPAYRPGTGVLRFRAARRAGLPARKFLGDSFRLRHGLVRTDRHHDAVHAAAVPVRADGRATVAGQHQSGFRALERSHGAGRRAESEFGAGPGGFRRGPERRVRLFAAMELHRAEDLRAAI